LQVKELYPRLQLRYSDSSLDRGLVLEQDPRPGTIVKAGRRIRLVVSQGVLINTIENYLGRNIDEVRMDIQTLFAAGSQAQLTLKEPFMYEYSAEPQGLILQQSPEPGTAISGPKELEFVVSRGPEHYLVTVPELTGLTPAGALEEIRKSKIYFNFTIRLARGNETPGTVVYQDPAAGTMVESNKKVSLLVAAPAPAPGEVFGLFKYDLPENPYPLNTRLEALLPGEGSRSRLAELDFAGGTFTLPYQLPPRSVLILSMLNREVYREEVLPPMDEFSLDQL
jgi:beta-lactam-binding protein with PASTA domain